MSDEKDEASELNPYAPPTADVSGGPSRARRRKKGRRALEEALARLDEHLSDPGNVEADRKAAGPRIRALTWGSALVMLVGLAMVGAGWDSPRSPLLPIGAAMGGVAFLLAIIALIMDLTLVQHGASSAPDAALKSILKAIPMGRFGYVWAALSPTARESSVRSPSLGPVETQDGEFSMSSEAGVKAYTGSFARPGGSQMRQMAVKKVTLASQEDDVAEVQVELSFQSWPRWVTVVTVVGFVLFRPAIIVGAILYYVTRKRHEVRVTRTLLRGRNGAWYLYDADILEGADS